MQTLLRLSKAVRCMLVPCTISVLVSIMYFHVILPCLIKFILYVLIALTVRVININGLPPALKIGAIFSETQRQSSSELAFKYAVHSINGDKGILPATNLLYDIQYTNELDSFHTCKKVCTQISNGVQAIFGPSNSLISSHVNSICDALDLPHLEVQIDADNEIAINLHPYQNYVNEAFLDAIQYLNWTRVGILHEKYYGRIQLRRLIRIPLEVHIRHVGPNNYLRTLNEMKEKEIHNLIIDTNSEHIQVILKGILRSQMNEYKYHYFFTSFDIELFDLEDFKYNFVNITSYRLVDINDVAIKEILKGMETFKYEQELSSTTERISTKNQEENSGVRENYRKRRTIGAEPALVFDSVYIFAIGLQTLEQSHTLRLKNMTCTEANPWDGGLSLINYINSVEWRGLTGPIQFKEGKRIQFKLDMVKLKQHSIVKVGEWSPQGRLNITAPSLFFDTGSMNVTLVVITILEAPYVMLHYGKNFTGNQRFFGFCVDVLDLVSRDVGFDYILDLVPDRKYGAKDPQTSQWNGMVAQLMKYKADLAVAPMTITHARESVIDFTKPFMNLGISILFKVPTAPPTKLFSFMNPLGFEIWLYVLAAYVFVSFTIYIVAKFSPMEHTGDKNNICINRDSENFNLLNSFWFAIGTLMQQDSDLSPQAFSTRIVSAIWWFFTLIIISSYTANLAAFLTVERMITPIENAEDLASQTEISYGTLDSGSTMTFFRDSLIETYRKMWRNMDNKKKPSALTSTYEEGIKRVKESNYAFLMESTMLDYIVQRDCNLTQIGGLLDTKGYGIATSKGSPWRDKVSLAILKLQEKGDIQMLYDKWWKNTGDTCVRNHNKKKSKANALGLESIGGVFMVLIVGIAVAICVAILEFRQYYKFQQREFKNLICLSSKHYNDNNDNDDEEKQTQILKINEYPCHSPHEHGALPAQIQHHRSLCVEMLDEFLYALRCMDRRKRPAFNRRCSQRHSLKAVSLNDMLLTTKATTMERNSAQITETNFD